MLSEQEIKMLGETILEAIDAKMAPIIEKVEKIEKLERSGEPDLEVFKESLKPDFQAVDSDIDSILEALASLENDTGKKFHVTAKILAPIMQVLKKGLGANVCAKDIEALALLMGEPIPETKGLNKDQLNELFEKIWKEHSAGSI